MAITYRDAGVDRDAGAELVRRIGPLASRTRTPEVLGALGGFAGLFRLPGGMVDPVLVSGADGVGTKIEIAFATGRHDTIGIDLVAMCVNDVVTTGARPLFFLDALSTGALDVALAEAVVRGIATGCHLAGCALLGGETAEVPGLIVPGRYELAGFAVGVVERDCLLDGSRVRSGDVLVAVASSGLHANGYALARRVLLDRQALALDDPLPDLGCTLAEELMRPTRIHARGVAALMDRCGTDLHAIAHITGGGLVENVPRALGPGHAARIDLRTYDRPAIFDRIAKGGPVDEAEMRCTFNLGIGQVVAVTPAAAGDALRALEDAGERAWILGDVVASDHPEVRFV